MPIESQILLWGRFLIPLSRAIDPCFVAGPVNPFSESGVENSELTQRCLQNINAAGGEPLRPAMQSA
jgi:hypothetical protein